MNYRADIESCLRVLNEGGLILYPTDTVWGIGCDATNEAAVQKVYALKQRTERKSMIILLPDEEKISHYAKAPSTEIKMLLQQPARPHTIIFPGATGLATNLIPPDRTIAIRIPQDDFCIFLLNAFKKPLVSTSANISGMPAPRSFSHISPEIKTGVDHIVVHRQNDESFSTPSRILQWTDDEKLIVIRE